MCGEKNGLLLVKGIYHDGKKTGKQQKQERKTI